MSNSTKFALETDPVAVIRRRGDRVVGGSTLWACIMVVVREVSSAVVKPARRRIDQSRPIDGSNSISNAILGVWLLDKLTPALVVNDLCFVSSSAHGI